MKLAWISLGVFGLIVTAVGCGTSGALDVFTSSNSNSGGEGGTGGASQSSSGQGGAGQSSSGQGGSGQGGSGQGGASVSSSSAVVSSSSSTAMASSSSSSGGPQIVLCAGQDCAAGEICCYNYNDPSLDKCANTMNCDPGYLWIGCDGPADCPGQVCCGTFNGQDYTDISCKPTCTGQGAVTMCMGDATVCPQNTTCQMSGILGGGYLVCRQ